MIATIMWKYTGQNRPPFAQPPDAGRYKLYGADASYYTAKIHAYLKYKRIPFTYELATRQVFDDIIVPRVRWKVIPVMVTPENETWQDTSEMIDALEARHRNHPVVPLSPLRRVLAYLIELYADEWLKLPALHYRWNYNRDFAVFEFGRNNDPDSPTAEQIRVGEKIASRFLAWLPALGVTERTIPAIEAGFEGLLTDLERHFDNHAFLLGDVPTLADFAWFGPFYAHIYRDPASAEMLNAAAPRTVEWIERIDNGPQPAPDKNRDDTVPETLIPVLRRLSDEYVPVLCETIPTIQDWLAQHSSGELPRSIGEHEFVLGRETEFEVTERRAVFSFDQWMLQRVVDAYRSTAIAGRRRVDATLAAIGAERLMKLDITRRVKRENFKLVAA